jgi:hypothetical protein
MAKNYASSSLGATIVDVTHPDSSATSNPKNLLLDQDGLVWLSGTAPQHVTIRLDDTHPPIQYVGWHVWQDYVTNPREVEVSSSWGLDGEASGVGASLSTIVKLCVAQPGAGSQVWQLDTPIPSGHRYVRFSILSTFGPGPTYMNRLFLYDRHPGDGYENPPANQNNGSVTTPTQAFNPGTSSAAYRSHTSATSVSNSSITLVRGGEKTPSNVHPSDASIGSHMLQSPVLHRSSSAPDMASTFQNRHRQQHDGRSSAAPYRGHYDDSSHHHYPPTVHYPNGTSVGSSTGRGASYPHPAGNYHHSARRGDSTNRSASTQMTDLLQGLDDDIKMLHPIRTISPSKGRRSHSNNASHLALGQYPSAVHSALDDLEEISRPPPQRSPPRRQSPTRTSEDVSLTLRTAMSRIDSLERAVGGLTTSMDAQGRDLRDIRELLMGLQRQPPPAPAPAPTPAPQQQQQGAPQQLIEFPEAALRGYIEDVLAPRLSKHAKRVEAKTLQRMDSHLQILLKEIGAVVDERVDRHLRPISHPPALPPMPTRAPSSYSDPYNTHNRSRISSPTRHGNHHYQGGGAMDGGSIDRWSSNRRGAPSGPEEGLINSRLGTPSYSLPPADDMVPRRPSIYHGSGTGFDTSADDGALMGEGGYYHHNSSSHRHHQERRHSRRSN